MHQYEGPERRTKSELMDVKISMLHQDVSEMKTVLRELTSAITRLALVEERIATASAAQERAFAAIDKIEAALKEREGESGLYLDLLKVVKDYEKHGVTCQTFRNFVDTPCAECNCTAPPKAHPMSREEAFQLVADRVQCSEAGDNDGYALVTVSNAEAIVRAVERHHKIGE